MLEQGDLITLSNNKEYAVVSVIKYEDVDYVYILETSEFKDYKICKCENEKLDVVTDGELLKVLISRFNADLKNNLASIIKKYE